jgi:repressor of nif and glnA expression
LKDIQEVLPDTSERTIRYDLQTLLEQNLIERIGNAGPSVFYRAGADAQTPAQAREAR